MQAVEIQSEIKPISDEKPWLWKKGQSGNPGGRPKTLGIFRERLRDHADKAIETLVSALDDENARVRVAAAAELLDRAYGKAPQAITDETGEGPLKLVIEWQRSAS